jgi:mono/diheme cytochrome c family protein
MTQTKKTFWISRLFIVIVPLIFLLGVYIYQQNSFPLDSLSRTPSQIELSQGSELFAQNCSSCHGVEGVGQNPESPNGGMLDEGGYLAPALNGTGHAWHHPNSVLFKTIKHGSIASDSSMRAFSNRLSDKEIVMIIHYFKSLWPDPIREKHSNLDKEEV